MNDIYVYTVPLPKGISETVTSCVGGFTIYLNQSLSDEDMVKAYNHALDHILLGHFDMNCDKNVQQMEMEAHYGKTKEVP